STSIKQRAVTYEMARWRCMGQPRAFLVPLVSGEINMISQSTIVPGHSTSTAVDYPDRSTKGRRLQLLPEYGKGKRKSRSMIRPSSDWTPEDRLTRARWMRAVGIFYGCIALIVFGFVLINERRVKQVMGSDVCIPLIYSASDRKCDLPQSAIR